MVTSHAFFKKLFSHARVMNTTPKPYNKIHLNYILAFIIFIICCLFQLCYQCVKSVIFDPYFPVFGLNTEIYGVSLHIQSECRKTRTGNDSDIWTHFTQCTSHKVFFLCISTFSLSCVQRFLPKTTLIKTLLRAQLKQTNLENRSHISNRKFKMF